MPGWLRRVANEINRVDRELVRRSAVISRWPTDPALRGLTTAANHSRLWLAVAATLAGALEQSHTYLQQERAGLRVEVLGPPVALAADGEVIAEGRQFQFFTQPAALRVYRPAPDLGLNLGL
ncbi:MAG: hypothetical protein JO115_02735 [Pseudonocardiales bacterium]|nr:hypothetical protein [Pseudonocardiales bacterium]